MSKKSKWYNLTKDPYWDDHYAVVWSIFVPIALLIVAAVILGSTGA